MKMIIKFNWKGNVNAIPKGPGECTIRTSQGSRASSVLMRIENEHTNRSKKINAYFDLSQYHWYGLEGYMITNINHKSPDCSIKILVFILQIQIKTIKYSIDQCFTYCTSASRTFTFIQFNPIDWLLLNLYQIIHIHFDLLYIHRLQHLQ